MRSSVTDAGKHGVRSVELKVEVEVEELVAAFSTHARAETPGYRGECVASESVAWVM